MPIRRTPLCEASGVKLILTERSEREMWLNAPWEIARELQRPLLNGALRLIEKANPEAAS